MEGEEERRESFKKYVGMIPCVSKCIKDTVVFLYFPPFFQGSPTSAPTSWT